MNLPKLYQILAFSLFLTACDQSVNQDTLTVYTSRQPQLIEPILDKYSEATGIDIVLLSGNAQQLLERIGVEGINSPADLFITVDAGVLWQASQANIFEPISSSILTNNIPKNFRDPEGKWFGLSKRIRAIVVNDKGNQAPPKSYHELAEKEWKNRLCLRTSAKVYNQSLIASMLFRLSEEETHKILSGWSNNLATKVFSSDTLALKAVQSGQCDATIVNSYYLGRLIDQQIGNNLSIIWPDQESFGVHVNISGGGVLKTSNNKAEAVKLLEWLSGKEAQKDYAFVNLEYPVLQDQELHPILKSWGNFKEDTMPVHQLGVLQRQAVLAARKADYN